MHTHTRARAARTHTRTHSHAHTRAHTRTHTPHTRTDARSQAQRGKVAAELEAFWAGAIEQVRAGWAVR
jgi:hypothetical protein